MSTLTRAFALVPLIVMAMMDTTAHAAPFDQNLSPNLHSNVGFSLKTRGNVAESIHLKPEQFVSGLTTKLGMARMSMVMDRENDAHENGGRDVWVYGTELIEIRDWLVALESYTVPEHVAQDAIQMLWSTASSGPRHPGEYLAAMLGDEYLKLFNYYTGVTQDVDSLKRHARLVKKYGQLSYSQMPLHTGFDWDFGKIQRGLLWEDAITNDKIPSMQDLGTAPQDKMGLLAKNTRKDLIQGLANCILQIDSGERGPVEPDIDQSLVIILRQLVKQERSHNQAVRHNREKSHPTWATGMHSMIPEVPSEWRHADSPVVSLDLLSDPHWDEDMEH